MLAGSDSYLKRLRLGQEQSLQMDFLDTTFDVYDLMVLFLVHRYVYLYTALVQDQARWTGSSMQCKRGVAIHARLYCTLANAISK
jgi:hypothetical protein